MNFCFRRRDLTSDTGKARWVSRRRRSLSCRSKVNLNSYRSAAMRQSQIHAAVSRCDHRGLRAFVYFDHAVCGWVRAENSISFAPRVGEGKGPRRQSFVGALTAAPLFPVLASALGSGWVSSQSVRAAASGSIPIFCHHDDSSPKRWTSR